MNNKKVLTLASIALLGTGGVVTALLLKDTVTNHLIEASEETYTLKLTNQEVGSDGSLSVETQDGNTITFNSTGLTYGNGTYTLTAGGGL